jgi:hypothetical protein
MRSSIFLPAIKERPDTFCNARYQTALEANRIFGFNGGNTAVKI